MIKLAVILSGSDFTNRRGLMNAALSRVEHLERSPEFKIDIFALHTERKEFSFRDFFKGDLRLSELEFEGRVIHVLNKYEFFSNKKLLRRPLRMYYKWSHFRIQDWEWHKYLGNFIKGFDAISAHFNDAAFIAEAASKKNGTPFFVTWHGSDIHTFPINDPVVKRKTISAIEHAACNFFVSEALLRLSDRLTSKGRKEVLYNGPDESFIKFTKQKRHVLRQQFGVLDCKVVTFAGSLRSIKNVDILPEIFYLIQKQFKGLVQFWVIGDGELKSLIERKCSTMDIYCKFWNSQPAREMPSFFNCTDVLVLPSQNEGFPLVALEALSCGANVVGSKVGGIPEAIGKEQTVEFGEGFINRFANKVLDILLSPVEQNIPHAANWTATANKERAIYKSIIND